MVSVITGDIKNSTAHNASKWLPILKGALNHYGEEPATWEVYRGDSFQLETTPEKALEASIYIKASIKQLRNLDVRMAIGLGEKTYAAEKITESNGGAFVNSGKCFENLKKQNLAFRSPSEKLNAHINLLLELALLTMDHWTPAISKTVKHAMENPTMNQSELASILNKSQGNISEELSKAGFDEIQKMMQFYQTQLKSL